MLAVLPDGGKEKEFTEGHYYFPHKHRHCLPMKKAGLFSGPHNQAWNHCGESKTLKASLHSIHFPRGAPAFGLE